MFDIFLTQIDVPELDGDVFELRKAQKRGELIDLALLGVLDLIAVPLASLVVNHTRSGRRSLNVRVKLHPAPRVGRVPGYGRPVPVYGPLSLESDCAVSVEFAELVVICSEAVQLLNELDAPAHIKLGGLMHARTPVIRVLRLTRRKRAFWLRNPVNILELRQILALFEVLQTGEAHGLDHRIHQSDSESCQIPIS